jgi:hypothetical protein
LSAVVHQRRRKQSILPQATLWIASRRSQSRCRDRWRDKLTRRANQQKPVKPFLRKYSCSRLPQISLKTITIPPEQGAFRDRHERAAGSGGRDSVGRATGIAGESVRALSDRPARGRTALQPVFARTLPDRTRSGGAFSENGRGRRSRVVLTPRCWRQVLRRCIQANRV